MTTITTRSGKGSPLTNDEVDANFNGLNTDKVEASGDSMTGDLSFGDNVKATFGDNDLQIFHDGSNSYVQDAGTGNLNIKSNGSFIDIQSDSTRINNAANNEIMATFVANGAVSLYHDNTARLATASTGVDVTGTVTADGGTIVSTGSNAFSSKAVGGYAIQAYQDATSSGHTALDLRSDATTGTRYLIRGYKDAAGTPTEVFSVGADGTATMGGLTVEATTPTLTLSSPEIVWAGGESIGSLDWYTRDTSGAGPLVASRIYSYSVGSNSLPVTNLAFQTTAAGSALKTGLLLEYTNDVSFYEDTGTTAKLFWDASAERLSVPTLSITDGSITTTAATGDHTVFNSTGADADFRVRTGANTHSLYVQGNTGYVGIGMTPSKLLDIQATDNLALRFYNSTSFKAGLEVVTTADDMISGSAVDDLAIRSQANMLFSTGGNTERMRISSTGIDVTGTAVTDNAVISGYMDFQTGGANKGNIYTDASTMIINTQGTNTTLNTNGGNVGVGTSPATHLHVQGSSGEIRVQDTGSGGGIVSFRDSGTSSIPSIRSSGNNLLVNTGGSESIRLDALGNLLVGQSSSTAPASDDTIGVAISPTGYISAHRTGVSAEFGRNTSDGDIAVFRKDGTAVGSIGVAGSRPYLANNVNFGIKLDDFGGGQLQPATIAGAVQDAACSLGGSSVRWKDLYLSGGVRGTSTIDITIPETSGGAINLEFGNNTNTTRRTVQAYKDNFEPAAVDTGVISLGQAGNQWKNLWLSGGVYLGGTLAANKLNDYEKGTFTGAVADASSGGNESSSVLNGTYVKIGAVVYAQFNVSNISTTGMTSGNNVFITGLPFAAKSVSGTARYTGTANLSVVTFEQTPLMQVNEGETFLKIIEIRSGAGNDSVTVSQLSSGASDIHGSLVYQTD